MSIKNNSIIRGLYFSIRNLSHYFIPTWKLASKGENVIITPPLYTSDYQHITIGCNCSLGPRAYISALNAHFTIKDNCAIAEGLSVHTGNHARLVGLYVTQITEENKPEGYDKDIVVEEDVWIGCNVTLLAGVKIGRGSTIAAGAVVTKSMPPYCICGGVPAKPIKFYWTIDQILEHEAKLYPENDRYTKEKLESIVKQV